MQRTVLPPLRSRQYRSEAESKFDICTVFHANAIPSLTFERTNNYLLFVLCPPVPLAFVSNALCSSLHSIGYNLVFILSYHILFFF